MSKIYEALLRAELERTVARGDRSPEAAAARAVQTLLSPEAADMPDILPEPTPELPAPELTDTLPLALEEPTLETEEVSTVMDFSHVNPRPWSPLPGYVPALEERGNHVEQFRSLRSHIMEFRDTKPLKSIVVSSGLPSEGKSFITLNLALSFSRHKSNRVLLIDGDMRRSSLHKALGAPNHPGLTDFLAGEKSLAEVLQRCAPGTGSQPIHPGLAALTFIAAGRDADNAGDLAASPKFAELISVGSSYFDWIFVDSSPANLVSDALSLARACDGVLLVARESITKFKTAQQAQAQFKNVNVLGVVLNAVHKLPVKGDYYGDYESYRSES